MCLGAEAEGLKGMNVSCSTEVRGQTSQFRESSCHKSEITVTQKSSSVKHPPLSTHIYLVYMYIKTFFRERERIIAKDKPWSGSQILKE